MYSLDFRKLALAYLRKVGSFRKAAAFCKVSTSTLHRWSTLGVSHGMTKPTGRPRVWCARTMHVLKAYLASQPNTTLCQMQLHLHETAHVRVGVDRLRCMLKKLGVSRKRTSKRFSKPVETSVQEAREASFLCQLASAVSTGSPVVSLDECYFSEKVLPLYGYSAKGQPCVVHAPTSSWQQRSLVLAVANDGSCSRELARGPVNRRMFCAFVKALPFPPGTTLILDNASIHRGVPCLEVYRTKGYVPLFTPPYSPQFNPVENVFAWIKHHFRSAWPWRQGVDASVQAASSALPPACVRGAFNHLFARIRRNGA